VFFDVRCPCRLTVILENVTLVSYESNVRTKSVFLSFFVLIFLFRSSYATDGQTDGHTRRAMRPSIMRINGDNKVLSIKEVLGG